MIQEKKETGWTEDSQEEDDQREDKLFHSQVTVTFTLCYLFKTIYIPCFIQFFKEERKIYIQIFRYLYS